MKYTLVLLAAFLLPELADAYKIQKFKGAFMLPAPSCANHGAKYISDAPVSCSQGYIVFEGHRVKWLHDLMG